MASSKDIVREHVLGLPRLAGQRRTRCPLCSDLRRKKRVRSMSVRFDGDVALYHCFHCEEQGGVSLVEDEVMMRSVEAPVVSSVKPLLSEPQLKWLATRGISEDTATRCKIVKGDVYMRGRDAEVLCLGFAYENADGTSATKWRDSVKNFSQTGAARSLWRISDWSGGDLVITEGELDALSFEEVGIFAASVPNGAPSRAATEGGSEVKYSYLWDAKDTIERASRIILALDADEPGRLLSEEIARRVGKGRCWKLQYPADCKDANDVLVNHGATRLKEVLSDATPWPVSGLRDVSEYRAEVMSLHEKGFESGMRVGIPELDEIFRVCPQTLTICTGIPGVGKSTFLSWVSVELARKSDWPVAVLSAETPPAIHLLQMAAVHQNKPYSGPSKMSSENLKESLDWLGERLVILDESDTQIDSVLERAQAAVLRMGVRVLIIDPYNFLTGSVGGTEEGSVLGINRLLVALKSFSVEHGTATFLVAHPVKMYRGNDGSVPVPTGYDISGSAAFFGICDLGISVSRKAGGRSLITVWKARFPWVGKPGEVELDFNAHTGVYTSTIPGIAGGVGDDDGWGEL